MLRPVYVAILLFFQFNYQFYFCDNTVIAVCLGTKNSWLGNDHVAYLVVSPQTQRKLSQNPVYCCNTPQKVPDVSLKAFSSTCLEECFVCFLLSSHHAQLSFCYLGPQTLLEIVLSPS